jgi:hypothetical protein
VSGDRVPFRIAESGANIEVRQRLQDAFDDDGGDSSGPGDGDGSSSGDGELR